MATDILVPTLGESVSTAPVARWLKKAGEAVAVDEPLVELETDKVTVEVNAPAAGVIASISADERAEVEPGGGHESGGRGARGRRRRPAPAASPRAPGHPPRRRPSRTSRSRWPPSPP